MSTSFRFAVAGCGFILVTGCSSDAGPSDTVARPIVGAVAFATTNGTIDVVSTGGSQPPGTATTGSFRFPRALLFDRQGGYAVVVSESEVDGFSNRGHVEVFDPASGSSLVSTTFPYVFGDADISPDGQHLYVTTSVVDLTTGARLLKIRVPSLALEDSLEILSIEFNQPVRPVTVAVNPSGSTILLGMNLGLTTLEVSTAPLTVINTIEVGAVRDIVFSPNGARAYLVSDEIVAVSTATKAILDTLQRSGLSPSDIVLNAAGDRAYVFMGDTTTSSLIDTMWVDVVDLSTGAALENLPLPGPVYGPVFPPSGDFIYVFSDRAVHVLSTVSVSIERTLSSDRVDGGVRSAVIP